jgi:uncharacterized protein YybS (DUF2232 family)
MINEKKCHACGKWTDGSLTHCAFCGSVIDPLMLAMDRKHQRLAEAKKQQLETENRFERYLRELEESEKPLNKMLFSVLSTLFSIYMAILSFFIWLIALISG